MGTHYKHLTVCLVILFSLYSNAQTVLVGPANGGDFESGGTSLIANGWNNSLPTTNRWHCNVFAVGNPTYSAYVRINASTTVHSYDNATAAIGHFWRDINFPAGDLGITIQFDWIGVGEVGYDRLRVYLVSTAVTPVAGTALTTGRIGNSEYSNSNSWNTTSITVPPSWAGTTGRLVFSWINDANTGSNPPAAVDNVIVTSTPAASALFMPTSGNTTVNVCNMPFYDSGAGNYSNNENGVLTICPSSPGTFVNISFSAFALENRFDYLLIYDGTSTNDRLIGGFNGTSIPSAIRASIDNSTGCLTLKFVSNHQNTDQGWTGHISCAATGSAMAPSVDNRDCYNAVQICNEASFAGNNTGAGMNELFTSWIPCAATGEDQANWFYFRMATGGTVGLTIDPGAGVDYDFAIWGPYSSIQCPVNTFHNPIRCSYSQLFGQTGLVDTASDVSEPAAGDKWIQSMNVSADDVYVMYINNYSVSSTAFNFAWNFTNGASLNCTPLPVEFSKLTGTQTEEGNVLRWNTLSEINSDKFEIQRSTDMREYTTIGTLDAAGNSNSQIQYHFLDEHIRSKGYYYRLKEIDLDGAVHFSNVIFIDSKNAINMTRVYPVPANDLLYIDIESNGDDDISIEIINTLGISIHNRKSMLSKGNNTVMMNTTDLLSGTYFIRISSTLDYHHIQSGFVKQ